MAETLAIIQGLESESSLSLTHAFIESYYEQAYALYLNGYYATFNQKLNRYVIALHPKQWTRRVR